MLPIVNETLYVLKPFFKGIELILNTLGTNDNTDVIILKKNLECIPITLNAKFVYFKNINLISEQFYALAQKLNGKQSSYLPTAFPLLCKDICSK
jgi:hypothetical protein